jgi:hypothetical protein
MTQHVTRKHLPLIITLPYSLDPSCAPFYFTSIPCFDPVDGVRTIKNLLFREYPVFVNCAKPEVLLFFLFSLEHPIGVTRSNESGVERGEGLPPPHELGGEPSQSRQDEARMRTKSRSRGRGLVLAALTLIVGMPELARAQQSGLFPNAPIKRQRVPCDQEDPVYKIYKQKYFGYHPTCWRPFPAGWGCPSPEKPDVEKSFKERKLGTAEDLLGGMPEEGTPGEQPIQRPDVPPLPPAGRSPFEQPSPTDRPANPATPRQGRQPLSPFEEPANPPAAAPNAPRAGRSGPSNPAIGEAGPELRAPEQPARPGGAQTSSIAPEESTEPREDDGPLLALPNVTLPPLGGPELPFGTHPAQPDAMTAEAAPAQPPQAGSNPRRGFLSGLFNNLGLNWTRR